MEKVLLFAFLLAFQGAATPPPPGKVTGILRKGNGMPATGVRISAMPKPETREDVVGFALVAIAQTDEAGRFRLEDVPPGSYFIVAGRVDRPTYYPAGSDIEKGKLVDVGPGAEVSGIDFTMNDESTRSEFTDVFRSALINVTVPLSVVADESGKIPFASEAGAVTLQFERIADGSIINLPVTSRSVTLQSIVAANTTDYRVTVANLPEGYSVRSIVQDGIELQGGALKIPASIGQQPTSADTQRPNTVLGAVSASFSLSRSSPQTSDLVISILYMPGTERAGSQGVRVSGLGRREDVHPVFLSGKQGLTFTDGSFEFNHVLPGRHTIGLVESPGRTMGATLIVGEFDIDNVQLEDVPVLPADIQVSREAGPAGDLAAGSRVSPVTLRGRVLEEVTKQPASSGQVYITGRTGPSYPIDEQGRFEISELLPGTYTLEIQIFGYGNVTRPVSVGAEDVSLELTSKKLY